MSSDQYSLMDYRILLREEFDTRRSRNPKYSLRSFARFLGVSAPYLSMLLQGKRTLSEKTGARFAAKLRWSPERKTQFQLMIRLQKAADEETKEALSTEIRDLLPELEFMHLRQNQFEIVSHWLHFAIAELSMVEGFKPDPKWIARRLGVSKTEVEEALVRLFRVGLLVKKGANYLKAKNHYRMADTPAAAVRSFHRQHLHRALHALENQAFMDRDITGVTLAFDRRKMAEVKALIREFRNKLNAFCEKNPNPDSVYQLAIQFVRLDSEGR